MSANSGPNPIVGAVTNAVNTFTNVANNAVKNVGANVAKVANQAMNGANKMINQAAPAINSIIPFGATPAAPVAAAAPANNTRKNNVFTNVVGNAVNSATNAVTNAATSATNAVANAATSATNAVANVVKNVGVNVPATAGNVNSGAGKYFSWPVIIFGILVIIFITLFTVFSDQVRASYETVAATFKEYVGLSSVPPVQSQITPIQGGIKPVTQPPTPPQGMLPDEEAREQNIVEKILPTGASNEVFNVAQNKFTFYDAEPLCRSLGAELATYEQVKDAWGKGADWCNYGWVKGQMAVYPTQKDTYDKMQAGPEEERSACGTVGINGGFFDNPDLRYGVNCYGKKPPQSAHDEKKLMEQGKIPKSPEALSVDKLINQFKKQKDSLFVRPFNDGKWSSS